MLEDEDLDFGLETLGAGFDFDVLDEVARTQAFAPKLHRPALVKYENAQEMAKSLPLEKGSNHYAILSGNFIMGDIFEAWAERHDIESICAATLGMSSNNVDSLVNCIKIRGVKRVSLIVSHYFFGVERHRLMRYISEEIEGLPFRVAVAGSHCKIALIETSGLYITVHGSANLSSNNSIEQISVTEDKGLFDFNREIFEDIFAHQTVIDGSVRDYKAAKNATGKKTWEVIKNG